MSHEFSVGSRKIGIKTNGERHPCWIVAELSANHAGSLQTALDTVQAAKNAGADAIKLQTYTPDTITMQSDKSYFRIQHGTIWDGTTLHQLYQEAYTPWEWHDKLFACARDIGLEIFSSPFDASAVELLENLQTPVYKVASLEITDIPLIEQVARTGKPVIFSTGIADKEDLTLAINTCRSQGNNRIAVLKCNTAYPAPVAETNLATIPAIREEFDVVSGLSDHTLGHHVAVAAVAVGASIIEKHFILDKNVGGPDVAFSMDPSEFATLVKSIRETEQAIGSINYERSPTAERTRMFGRSLFWTRSLPASHVVQPEDFRSVRPAHGLHPKYASKLVGKTLACKVSFAEPVATSDFETEIE